MQIRTVLGEEGVHQKKKHCVQRGSVYNKELIIKLILMGCG